MAHSRTFDITDPADSGYAGDGGQEIREFKEDVEQRMQLDHYWDSATDTALPEADGYHKQVTLKALLSSPTPLSGAGVLYTQTSNGVVDLFYKNSTGTYKVPNREAYLYSASLAATGYFSWNAAIHDDISLTISTTDITVPIGSYILEIMPPAGYGMTSTFEIEIAAVKTAFSGLLYKLTVAAPTTFKIYGTISAAVIASMRIRQL